MTTLIQTPLSRELNDFIELNREKLNLLLKYSVKQEQLLQTEPLILLNVDLKIP